MRIEFADCELDLDAYVLRRDGAEVPVEPGVFDVIRVLAEQAGTLVTKDSLIEAVWDGRIVSDATISARVSAARAAVGDTGRDQAIIRTVSRRGFQMVAETKVTEAAAPAPTKAHPEQVIRYTSAPDGTSIAWSLAGEGPPLLFAFHHLSHLERDWASDLMFPIFASLAGHHSLIRFDNRGTGLSDPIGSETAFDDHVADMEAVADAAGLNRFPIVACLQSCAVAIRFAARHPDRVSRLVLLNPYARGRAMREGAPAETENDPFIALLRSGGWGDPGNGFMRAWATMVLPMATADETTELIRLIANSGTAEQALHHRELIDRIDVMGDLRGVRAPTRVVHARLCSIHPVTEGRKVAAGIPGAEFVEVDSSNTVLISSDPAFDRFICLALEFLSNDGPDRGQ